MDEKPCQPLKAIPQRRSSSDRLLKDIPERNVYDAVEAPRAGKKTEFNVYSRSQVVAFFKATASDRLNALAVTTGMRSGESYSV